MTVTIKDVASRAGVSPKTVSRVMNGEAHVRAEVREAVQRVIADMGYRPNAFARGLSSARSFLLTLFIDDAGSSYAIAMQRGALRQCRQSGFHLVTEPIDLDAPGWEATLDEAVRALRPDGALIAPPLSQQGAFLDRLDELGLPYVCISPDDTAPIRSGSVGFDEEEAAFEMTSHLLSLGHREIAFVEGEPTHAATRQRRTGFLRAMDQARLTGTTHPGDFSFRAGLVAGEALLAGSTPPTAVFASNDDMALGVSVAAIKQAIAIPGELSIAGFDDAPTARLAWPPLTTVRQPVEEMATLAVEMLADPEYRDSMTAPKWQRSMPFDLVLRESVAERPPFPGQCFR